MGTFTGTFLIIIIGRTLLYTVNYTGMEKTSLDISSRTLFVREGGREDVLFTSNVELRNYVPLFDVTQSNVFFFSSGFSRHLGSPLWLLITSFQ